MEVNGYKIEPGADLRFAKLEGANLSGAKLMGANLMDANLEMAYLRGADMEGANLSGATLFRADLRGVILVGADLRDVILEGADLTGADLTGADLTDAVICRSYPQTEAKRVELKRDLEKFMPEMSGKSDAELQALLFGEDADLTGVKLTGTTMPDGSVHD